jgi:hypothetical protein
MPITFYKIWAKNGIKNIEKFFSSMPKTAKDAQSIFCACKFAANAFKILKLKRIFFVKERRRNPQQLYEKFTPQT